MFSRGIQFAPDHINPSDQENRNRQTFVDFVLGEGVADKGQGGDVLILKAVHRAMETKIDYAARDGEDGVSHERVLDGAKENVIHDAGEEGVVGQRLGH